LLIGRRREAGSWKLIATINTRRAIEPLIPELTAAKTTTTTYLIMPKLQATVPKGAPPNALLRVRLPDGAEVNVRIPDGLSEGKDFIFEIDSMGGVTASMTPSQNNNSVSNTPNKSSAKKDSSLNNKSNKHAKKKNKKSNHASAAQNNNNNKVEKAPSFVTFFFNYYNLVYDMVMNTLEGGTSTYKVQESSNHATNNAYVGLLDREIVTGVDFCVALCVGIFIGLSIVMGFISGVLWVTPIGLEA